MRVVHISKCFILSALFIASIFTTECFAQFQQESLYPYNGTIASASKIVTAGTGLAAPNGVAQGVGSISINVPGEVQQVILFWNGFVTFDSSMLFGGSPVDETISINSTQQVQGTIIGGITNIFNDVGSVTLRADITDLNLITSGDNTITLSGLDFDRVVNGAGLMVLYDDGTAHKNIQIREGQDYAFIGRSPGPLQVTEIQTFGFEPSLTTREVSLQMFFGSVAGSFSGVSPERPNSIEVTVDDRVVKFSDRLNSLDGEEWDTLELTFLIPPGVDDFSVQPISRDDNNTGKTPASFTWIAAAMSIENPDQCPDDLFKSEPGICGCGIPDIDSDGDGLYDCQEECPEDAMKAKAGVCGCGISDLDSDGDGISDCVDLCPDDEFKSEAGICGCGFSEEDQDLDSVPDCQEMCVLDPNKTDPGICGCGFSDVDTDNDGIADCLELCIDDPNKTEPGDCGCGIAEDDPICNPIICVENNLSFDTLIIDNHANKSHALTEMALKKMRSIVNNQGGSIAQKKYDRVLLAMDELYAGDQGTWILANLVLPQSEVSCEGVSIECSSSDLSVTKVQIMKNQRAYRNDILKRIVKFTKQLDGSSKKNAKNYIQVTRRALKAMEKRQKKALKEIPDSVVTSCL